MFIGHYGPAFVTAARLRRPGLLSNFIAVQLIDIVFFTLLLVGVEHLRLVPGATAMNPMDLYDMPWDHSLLGATGWAIVLAVVLRLLGIGWRGASIGGALVLSHWLLDLIVHRPDLTLAGAPPRLGLGLWNLPAVEMPLELVLAYGGLLLYARATRPRGLSGRLSLAALAVGMAALQAVNWTTPQPRAVIDPPPASVGWLGLFAYGVLAALAAWTAATREARA